MEKLSDRVLINDMISLYEIDIQLQIYRVLGSPTPMPIGKISANSPTVNFTQKF